MRSYRGLAGTTLMLALSFSASDLLAQENADQARLMKGAMGNRPPVIRSQPRA